MKSKYAVFGFILILLASGVSVFGIDTETMGKEILETIDRNSNFMDRDFASHVTITTEDPKDGIDRKKVHMFRRDKDETFLMLIDEPSTEKGQGYLNVDDNLWFYDPESRKFSHTSMKEHFGNTGARNSDFRNSRYAKEYRVTAITEGKLGDFSVNILEMEGLNDEVSYPYKTMWVERSRNLVLKTEDYSLSKRLMRTSLFPSYSDVDGIYIPSRMIYIDRLIEGRKTQVLLNETSIAPLPDSIFTKAYVERVNR